MKNEEVYRMFTDTISHTCRRTSIQMCHICENENCGDNDNPLVRKIKKLEEQLQKHSQTLDTTICPSCIKQAITYGYNASISPVESVINNFYKLKGINP